MTYCNAFIVNKCNNKECEFEHIENVCKHFWNFNKCKFDTECRFKHIKNINSNKTNKNEIIFVNSKKHNDNKNLKKKHVKNTETFIPIKKSDVDIRIVFHDSRNKTKFDEKLTSKDVLVVNNLFDDFNRYDIYNSLVNEIESCGIRSESLLKLWHGDSHLIADDKLNWKINCPTFNMVLDRIQEYFDMDIQATRFNWYKDTSQWKPYHKDSSAINPEKAKIQNFTLAVSFGTTRETSFERDTRDKTKISIPVSDGSIYAFCKDTNVLWRHGILKEDEIKNEGRISIIAWGKLNQ